MGTGEKARFFTASFDRSAWPWRSLKNIISIETPLESALLWEVQRD